MASGLQGGLCSCRSEVWRRGMAHRGAGPAEEVSYSCLSRTLETSGGTLFLEHACNELLGLNSSGEQGSHCRGWQLCRV